MRRLTVHLKNVKKEKEDNGKMILRNTLSFYVNKDSEVTDIVNDLNKEGNVTKWYVVNSK